MGKGDLMLCPSCDTERRRLFDEACKAKADRNASTRSRISSKSSASSAAVKDGDDNAPLTTTCCVITATSSVAHDGSASTAHDRIAAQPQLQPVSAISDMGSSDDVITEVNELLSYVQFYRDRSSVEALHKILIGFFHAMEITEAKRLLIERFMDEIADCPLKTVRRQSSVRSAHDAEAEDIIRIMELLDNQDDLKKVRFAATNFDRLPKYGPEEINVCSVMDKQVCWKTRSIHCLNR